MFANSKDFRPRHANDHADDNRTLGACPSVGLNRPADCSVEKLFAGGDLNCLVCGVQRETGSSPSLALRVAVTNGLPAFEVRCSGARNRVPVIKTCAVIGRSAPPDWG
jgi:hypothetical protein